ncbi:Tethering factor for nuclear proteasome sts1 [Knufia obscura]|uniref:Tethering factor for nuclear proteasome STS1 n=2 Tax=Knufia TaxID=430999 RepID=A0AAN8EIT3_9EURO|nr:Tethering factor for nuclear proteasome sts1 [Knufia obscura]KAK5956478.1 Tethering factor for nuclear proteasome sts1 [Knufia fluminis]
MSSLATPPIPPHFYEQQRLSPTRSSRPTDQHYSQHANMESVSQTPTNSRKRKASPSSEDDHEMSTSPQPSNARLPPAQPMSRKRARPNLTGRPLTVDRLLETLDKDSLRSIVRTLSDRNPQLRDEILNIAPRPSVNSTLEVLRQYLDRLRSSFPLDPNPRSDYSYDRVRPQWNELLDALTDFTPHFLPPNESQSSTSLTYLDGVTQIITELPEWDTAQHNLAKQNAYAEISKAWSTVIKEASKRGGGIQLQYGGWEEKLRVHNQRSRGQMQDAYDDLASALGWLRPSGSTGNGFSTRQDVRNQLFSGTYGTDQGQNQQQQQQQQPVMNMRTGNGNW